MISILDLKARAAAPVPAKAPAEVPEPVKAEISTEAEPERTGPEEYEFVLGRRQVAGLSFVATVVLMICVAAAYLAGKSTSVKVVTIQAPAPVAAPVQPAPLVVKVAPVVSAPAPVVEPPLFQNPKQGAVYIQMGAVEKGIAVIFAEGLRKRGLPGFVAPGPSEKIFRVLIGPLPDPASYMKTKSVVDGIGLETFAKRIQD
jgi:hypothetical protein